MDIKISISLIFFIFITVVFTIIRKRISHASVDSTPAQEPEIQPSVPELLEQIFIGNNPALPLVTIKASASNNDFEEAKPLNFKSDKSISRLSALCQAVPSLLVAGEASGKKLMEVVINGDLVRAADGNGLRAFAMNGKGISENARLFEVSNLQNMINAAAVWQIASVIVAQKHLADISRKLDEIKAGVQYISQFLENQRKSRILATHDYLEQVYLAIKGGDLPDASRINLESCERDLLEIQHHLEIEYHQKIDKKVKHTETFGTEDITNDIEKKISELKGLVGDISLCLKTRIAAWHVLSLFPGDPQLKVARRINIQKSIDSFSSLAPHLDKNLKNEISNINAFWNKNNTINTRKRSLNSKRITAVRTFQSNISKSSEYVNQSEHVLLEHDKPTHFYLQFQNGELIDVRQAA